jgi:parvulin-like peptidyl-prolyl isomerase
MRQPSARAMVLAAALIGTLAAPLARAEVVEEIVAKVNDDIIAKSDLDEAEREAVAEIYRSQTGKDLDQQVAEVHKSMLRELINQKVLLHRAQRLYDMEKLGDAILDSFKDYQKIQSDEDLKRMLAQEGMTLSDLKKKLIEMHAWRQVLDAEVRNRIAVGDKEVEAYYGGHPDEFHVPGDVTLREIVLLADSAHRQARRSEAEAIRAKAAAAGADFAAIAKEFSEAGTKANGGLIGPVKKGELAPALETAAMSLPIGEVSPIIETDYGLYVIKVESRNEDREKPLEDVKEPIRGMLEADRFRIAVADYLHKIWNESEIWIAPKYKNRLSPEPPGSQAAQTAPPPQATQ